MPTKAKKPKRRNASSQKGKTRRKKRATPQKAKATKSKAKVATAKRRARVSVPLAAPREKHPGRPEQTAAFFPDARHASDELAEELGESFVLSVTSGEDTEELHERELDEEDGGPFLETSGRTEFAYDVDESNPEDAEPAPWPAVSPGQPPPHRPGGPK